MSLLVGLVYISIAPTRLTNSNFGSDAGDFLAAILTHGIPHPTGYPTYVLLGMITQNIPISTPVFRGVLESLVPAALAAGLLTGWLAFVIGAKTITQRAAAVVAGLAWGITPLLFSQAVIVEVHSLQSLIGVIVLWWITLNLQEQPQIHRNWILCLSFLIGVGLGNHLTIVLIAPAMLIALIFSKKNTGNWKLLVAQLTLMLVGSLVYLYLPLSARAYPPINWGNPQTMSGFIWEVTGNPYKGLVFHTETTILWDRIRSVASLLLDEFGPIGLIAGVIGLLQFSFHMKVLRWILVWIFVIYFVFAIGYSSQDSVSYLLPAVMVFAIWLSLAIPVISGIRWNRVPLGLLLSLTLVVSLLLRIPSTRVRVDPRLADQPARFAEQFLRDAPPNAIVNTSTDQDSFPLWFYHFGLLERPDLRVIVLPLTQFVWYQETLLHTYSDLAYPPLYEKDTPNTDWGKQILTLNPDRPVCITAISSKTDTGIAYECTSP